MSEQRFRFSSRLALLIVFSLFLLSAGQRSVHAETEPAADQCSCVCPAAVGETDPAATAETSADQFNPAATEQPAPSSADEAATAAIAPPRVRTIVISELLPDPVGSDTAGEFVELRNVGTSDLDFSGWRLANGTGKSVPLPSVTIGAGAYYSFVYAETKLALVNSGMALSLIDPDGAAVDAVTYAGPAKEGQSYAKNDSGLWAWTTSPTPGAANQFPAVMPSSNDVVADPTTSAAASDEAPAVPSSTAPLVGSSDTASTSSAVSSGEVVINEFLPDPVGDDAGEWIELYNPGATDFPLLGWRLDDAEGGSAPFLFGAADAVPAGGYLVVDRSRDRLALNNDGDSVRLIDAAGDVAGSVSYVDAPEGKSFARYADGWRWSNPTPGRENLETDVEAAATVTAEQSPAAAAPESAATAIEDSAEESAISATISELSELDEGSLVNTEGIVSMPPGVVAKTVMAVQDAEAESAILVRLSGRQMPDLSAGSRVGIIGRIRISNGESAIYARAADVTALPGGALSSVSSTLGEIAEAASGLSVAVTGPVSAVGKNWLKITDETGEHETKVVLPKGWRPVPTVGSRATAKAVVRRRTTGVELIVLDRTGLVVETSAPAAEQAAAPEEKPPDPVAPAAPIRLEAKSGPTPYAAYGFAAAAMGAAVLAAAVWRKRQAAALQE